MNWTVNSTMEDFKIRKSDKFVCTSDVELQGCPEKILYKAGFIYKAEKDNCITDEFGDSFRNWAYDPSDKINWPNYFQRYNEEKICVCDVKGEAYCGCKPDRDYFQTVQDEYGNFIKVGNQVVPGVDDKFDGTVKIMETFANLSNLLVYKNTLYGNSGLTPINVFSKVNAETGLLQRLDDKIARVQNSPELRKNDVADIIGYLVLICVSKGWTNFDEFKD